MIITCHGCHAEYSIADEKVRHRNVRVRCRECETVIRVERLDGRTSAAPPAAARSDYPSPFDARKSEPPMPASTPRAQVMRRDDDARARRDLFGQDEVSRREQLPAARDVIPPPAPLGLHTAARNENSVLFSLAALAGSKSSTPPPAPAIDVAPGTRKKEDSGLIDLGQLMAQSSQSTDKFVPPPIPSEAPIGAFTTEVSTSYSDSAIAFPRSSKRRRQNLVVAAGGAMLAVLALVGIVSLSGGSDKKEVASTETNGPVTSTTAAIAAAAAAQPPPAPLAPLSTSIASSLSDAKPIAASMSDLPSGKKGKGKHHGKAAHAGKSHSSGGASAPAKPPAAPDPCGCHGNLACAMQCAAK